MVSTRVGQLPKEELLSTQTQLSRYPIPISITLLEMATIFHSRIKEPMVFKMFQNSKMSAIKAIFQIWICTGNLTTFIDQKLMMLTIIMKAASCIMGLILEIVLLKVKLPAGM